MIKFNKGYTIIDLFIFIISSVVIVLFFAGWIYGLDQINTIVEDVGVLPNTEINMTTISQDTLGYVNEGMSALRLISLLMIFGYMLNILLSAWLVRKHPGLGFLIYFIITAIAVIFSTYVSNAYELLLVGNVLSETLNSFTASTFIVLNLPIIVTVLGFAGMILLFSGIPRDPELGGSIV